MNNLTAEAIQDNWKLFINNIKEYISEPRQSKLIEFYKNLQDRLIIYPASNKSQFHNCMPGGYIDHINRVVKGCQGLYKIWKIMGTDTSSFTLEELIFSAINHDLGKIGTQEHEAYLPSEDEWRKKNLGEHYSFNTKLQFMSVPDRGLFLLQEAGIPITENEFIGIKTHDGLYDQANEVYLKSYIIETKPRTSLPYILHQADLMAARIEFEKEHLNEGQLK